MSTTVDMDERTDDWRMKTLIIGAVIGALVGLGGAYLLVQNAEKQGARVTVTTGDGVRLGLLMLGTLRQVAALGEK